MKLSERILAAKGPIYKKQRKRWAADAERLENIIGVGAYLYPDFDPSQIQTTHSSSSEAHIVEEMRVSKQGE